MLEAHKLRRFLQYFAIDCVFDVGANEGMYGHLLREIGFKGTIISFEPSPDVFEELKRAAAQDDHWHTMHLALDVTSRMIEFNVMRDSQFSSLHKPSQDGGDLAHKNAVVRTVEVLTNTVNDLYDDLKRRFGFSRPFLKMDTQGHDMDVFRGATRVISNFVGLQSELSIVPLYEGVPIFTESLAEYERHGFKLNAFVPNNAGHFPDLREFDCLMYNTRFA